MLTLDATPRSLPMYRQSLLVDRDWWITSLIQCYYLDLEVSNARLFQRHSRKVFPTHAPNLDFAVVFTFRSRPRFFLDDIAVGCEGNKDSVGTILSYIKGIPRRLDRIGMSLFLLFTERHGQALRSGRVAERYIKLAKLVSYREWKDKRLPNTVNQLFVDEFFKDVYPLILEGIYEFKLERPLLIKDLWDVFCFTDKTKLRLFMTVDLKYLEFMLERANVVKFDFWGLRNGLGVITRDVIEGYVEHRRLSFIIKLLDFGFDLGKMIPKYSDWRLQTMTSDLSRYAIPNISLVWFLVANFEYSREDVMYQPEFVEVVQKLSRSLSKPSLPSTVVRKHLQKAFRRDRGYLSDVDDIIQIYEECEIHPPDSDVVFPLTLRQICRAVVRKRLAANYQMPNGIDELPLPNFIKRFLKLEF